MVPVAVQLLQAGAALLAASARSSASGASCLSSYGSAELVKLSTKFIEGKNNNNNNEGAVLPVSVRASSSCSFRFGQVPVGIFQFTVMDFKLVFFVM